MKNLSRTRRRASHRRLRQGGVAVEFALIFPIVMTFFLVNIFFIQFFLLRNTANNAAYVAARRGIVLNSTEEESRNDAARILNTINAKEVGFSLVDSGDQVTVTIEIPVGTNTWVSGVFIPQNMMIRESCVLSKNLN